MTETRSLDELRKKAHRINCDLSEEDYTPREIEVIGYYLHRIAASYLSYLTHRELEETIQEGGELTTEELPKSYKLS